MISQVRNRMGILDNLKDAAKKVTGGAGDLLTGGKNAISKGLSKAADLAADTAADAALAPLKLIENEISKVSKLGPDIVAARRAEINDMLTGVAEAAAARDNELEAKKLRNAKAVVLARVKQVTADSSVPDDIKHDYEIILQDENATPEELLNNLADADDALLVHEDKEFSGWRLIKRAWRFSSDYIYYILLLITAFFGGIILSNVYIEESYLPIRLYYFFYGTAFFPISLMYGIVNPPEWNATIFPLFKKSSIGPFVQGLGPVLHGQRGGAPPTDIKQGTGIVAARSAAFRGPPNPEVVAAMQESERSGNSPAVAGQKAITALEATGVSEEVAKQEVVKVLERKGIPHLVAIQSVSGPRPAPTMLQRLTAIGTELFGYRTTGGSTLSLRIISMTLTFMTVAWSYFRGDLAEAYEKLSASYGLVAPAPKELRGNKKKKKEKSI